MRRRDVVAGMALAAAGAQGQQRDMESLYIPKPHRVEDRKLLHDFMDEYAFVDLVTPEPSIRITHIPVLLDRTSGQYGTIYGHVSRSNPQSRAFEARQSALIVFRGPHSYISPSWYANTQAVPTWNFAVVHASGKLKAISETKALHDLLVKLVNKFEGRYTGGAYDLTKLPESYTNSMIAGIIGFEMPIDSLEGKFKLGQERSAGDRAGILKHLEGVHSEPPMRDFTASWYERFKKPD